MPVIPYPSQVVPLSTCESESSHSFVPIHKRLAEEFITRRKNCTHLIDCRRTKIIDAAIVGTDRVGPFEWESSVEIRVRQVDGLDLLKSSP